MESMVIILDSSWMDMHMVVLDKGKQKVGAGYRSEPYLFLKPPTKVVFSRVGYSTSNECSLSRTLSFGTFQAK